VLVGSAASKFLQCKLSHAEMWVGFGAFSAHRLVSKHGPFWIGRPAHERLKALPRTTTTHFDAQSIGTLEMRGSVACEMSRWNHFGKLHGCDPRPRIFGASLGMECTV
jgi:hypothetical protein